MVISRRAAAIATSSGIIDQEYLDETLEPDRRQQIPDALWRAIRAPRGGRRGLSTKVRHIREGIDQGFYKGNYPFVTREGLEYARQWRFQVCDSVLQGATVWEIETSSSEEEVQILERPAAKARPTPKASEPVPVLGKPAAKARPTSKVPEPSDHPAGSTWGTSSASSSSVLPPAKPSGTHQLRARAKPSAKAIERILKPRPYLPDTVVWFDRENKAEDVGSGQDPVGVNFKEVSNYSSYRGYKTYIKADSPEYPKFILFLDWHQVLDRSRTEGTWNDKFPEDSITFLNRLKGAAEETWGHRDALLIVIVSHIEHSSKNLDNLLRICNQYRQIADEGIITSIFITRERCGVVGKAATIKSYTLDYQIPCALVDDNHEVISENSAEVHTCHIQIRRKPKCPAAETVQHYLLDCAAPLERLLWRYRHR